MDKLIIIGGNCFDGEICIFGVKNLVLLILVVILLVDILVIVCNLLYLYDIIIMIELFGCMGVQLIIDEKFNVEVDVSSIKILVVLYELVKIMCVLILVLGLMLVCFGEVEVVLLGGCVIGLCLVDLYICGFEVMGVQIEVEGGYIKVKVLVGGLCGGYFFFDIVSVIGIENLMMVVVLVNGCIVLQNVVCELEVVDLVNCLNVMGVNVQGVGFDIIVIEGVKCFGGVCYDVLFDCIEIGIYLVVVVVIGGWVKLKDIDLIIFEVVLQKLEEVGVYISIGSNWIELDMKGNWLKVVNVCIVLYLVFFIDMQVQFIFMNVVVEGIGVVIEMVFENCFMYVYEMNCMGV